MLARVKMPDENRKMNKETLTPRREPSLRFFEPLFGARADPPVPVERPMGLAPGPARCLGGDIHSRVLASDRAGDLSTDDHVRVLSPSACAGGSLPTCCQLGGWSPTTPASGESNML